MGLVGPDDNKLKETVIPALEPESLPMKYQYSKLTPGFNFQWEPCFPHEYRHQWQTIPGQARHDIKLKKGYDIGLRRG